MIKHTDSIGDMTRCLDYILQIIAKIREDTPDTDVVEKEET